MTRINTNVSSLNAQKTLARSNAQLQESLTRLSTGLRINSGKDDPAGLIASETLRSDIVSTQVAITNSERANQMIATADSALGQVSSLLNDVRGLVSEAANVGAMSSEQIAANQLQVDSSLEAIDRIAQVTQFQGKRLLDGSLDFLTQGIDHTSISDLQIEQANFGYAVGNRRQRQRRGPGRKGRPDLWIGHCQHGRRARSRRRKRFRGIQLRVRQHNRGNGLGHQSGIRRLGHYSHGCIHDTAAADSTGHVMALQRGRE